MNLDSVSHIVCKFQRDRLVNKKKSPNLATAPLRVCKSFVRSKKVLLRNDWIERAKKSLDGWKLCRCWGLITFYDNQEKKTCGELIVFEKLLGKAATENIKEVSANAVCYTKCFFLFLSVISNANVSFKFISEISLRVLCDFFL